MKTENEFPALLEAFFTDRLCHQRQASPHTIASYRDTFCLLLGFAKEHLKKEPSARQYRPQPQCAPRGPPFVLPLRSPPQARDERPGAARFGNAIEAVSPHADPLLDTA
jgi:hypothetical protein